MKAQVLLGLAALLVGCNSDAPSKNSETGNNATNSTNTGSNSSNGGTNSTPNNSMSELGFRVPGPEGAAVDLLFVVDNSGSMCQEQRVLRDNFELLADELISAGVDFHLGVTTTDMNPDYVLEPLAQPGYLQSTPQPIPAFDRSCHTSSTDSGQPIPGDYAPIRDAIAAAVDCMENPDDSYNSVTNAQIECGLYATPNGCSTALEDLFPPPDSYRQIPKVLRSADYGNDVDRLKADFGCMAQVGVRGYGIEKGLGAAVEAVSPNLTGGAVDGDEVDTTAPNHGLLRRDTKFGLIFVTDENDCTHDGTLAEDSACGGNVCEFANKEGTSGPLIDPAELKDQLIANLRGSKGDSAFGERDVVVASVHGNSRRFDGAVPTDAECGDAGFEGIQPSCATALGVAFSGDRYERFLRSFPEGQTFPAAVDASTPLTGWICTGDFRPALAATGQQFSVRASGCIDEFSCSGAGCTGAIELRVVVPDLSALEQVVNSGYCAADSTQSDDPLGCIIDPSKYSTTDCTGASGVVVQWADVNEAINAVGADGNEFYLSEL